LSPADFPGPAGAWQSAGDTLRARAHDLRARRTPFVEATVVRAVRPTSAKAGDRALVLPDGTIEGFVGGSCAEASVRLHSLRVLRAREPVMLRIIPPPEVDGAGDWAGGVLGATTAGDRGRGVPAAGSSGAQASGLSGAGIARARAHGVAGAGEAGVSAGEASDASAGAPDPTPDAATAGAVEGLVTVSNPCASGGLLEIFLEGVFPPPLIQVCGDAPIARALQAVGEALGYEIRPAGPAGEPVATDAAAVIVASHGRDEEPVLNAALRAGVPYVGLVASRRRGAQVVAVLDVPAADRPRLRTPAGLDIGARTPGEIALSIFAEIIATRQPPAAGAVGGGSGGSGSTPVDSPGGGIVPAGSRAGGGPGTAHAVSAAAAAGGPALARGETTDPVCGMTVAVTRATPQMTHDGRMWFFCGPGCRQAFADDPARYQG
jgi:xanthine dehydrogenase accessory factor